jgi:nucleotide-binding universal stress UspA family protein
MKVLVLVDLRSDAADVVDEAIPWLVRLGAVADLVFVDTLRGALARYTPPALQPELAGLEAEDDERMQALLTRLPVANRGAAVLDTESIEASLAARAARYALVAVGTAGRTGLAHLWLGSVAEQVVRTCPRSVLVLRDHAPSLPVRVLMALDLGEEVEPLLRALVPWAVRAHATVDLLSVQQVPVLTTSAMDPAVDAFFVEHVTDTRRRIGSVLEHHRNELPASARGEIVVDIGSPASSIVDRAADYDLVVVGTHARGGFAHAVYGSVAENVVRRAARPVLVLRTS